ncbi:AAA family ATPase [Ensifer adhaerens]|uniref:AAA family ATPase n=1 Tax=Ensifer adhaerens TaxID=106592 RepID=UPI00098EF28E|nr:AAA family ATPase [Ensifer adhaerens]
MAKREPPREPDEVREDDFERIETYLPPNGHGEPQIAIPTKTLAAITRTPPKPRAFLDERGLLPIGNVTLLTGDGGTGKSLLALQLAMAVASGGAWLNGSVRQGKVLYLSAEEDEDEINRRACEIAAGERLDLAAMAALEIMSLVGDDAVLALEAKGRLVPTSLFERLSLTMAKVQPGLLTLDNLADAYAGNENSRPQARQFIGMLRRLAVRHQCVVLLLGHPSLTGINTGTGLSGSTAWNNSVRSRLYLRDAGENDGAHEGDSAAKVLESMKANYGPKGIKLNLRWDCGALVCTDRPDRAGSDIGRQDKARRVFVAILRFHNENHITASAGPTAGNYAPKLFYPDPLNENISIKELAAAMRWLLANGKIANVLHGPKSKETRRLEVVECNF